MVNGTLLKLARLKTVGLLAIQTGGLNKEERLQITMALSQLIFKLKCQMSIIIFKFHIKLVQVVKVIHGLREKLVILGKQLALLFTKMVASIKDRLEVGKLKASPLNFSPSTEGRSVIHSES